MCKVGDIIVVKNFKSQGKEIGRQFYYFDRNKIDFYVLGKVTPELFNELLVYIQSLSNIQHIVDNLSS